MVRVWRCHWESQPWAALLSVFHYSAGTFVPLCCSSSCVASSLMCPCWPSTARCLSGWATSSSLFSSCSLFFFFLSLIHLLSSLSLIFTVVCHCLPQFLFLCVCIVLLLLFPFSFFLSFFFCFPLTSVASVWQQHGHALLPQFIRLSTCWVV